MAERSGFPLWCPNPNKNLYPDYVASGIRIGDVGIITSNGEFDFLFNICLSADHPVNGNRVPEGFKPIAKPDPADMNSDTEQFPGAFLMSKSINGKTGTRTLPPLGVKSDYYFQCVHYEGAILIMPEGSYREDLRNLGTFRRYATMNGESWYRYANGTRGREVVNGSIHLVTGYDKSTSWALGAFSHGNSSVSGLIDLQFSATTVNSGHNSSSEQIYTYYWNQSGPARVKYGPTPVPSVMNQSLFVHSFCVELNTSIWT
ncbi:hypothetical protein BDQ17DRAFT_1244886 [Cyathus striatus]|nr:hypothetical protein BDQ17DRAFT_1244886 [Cyathus striatus]